MGDALAVHLSSREEKIAVQNSFSRNIIYSGESPSKTKNGKVRVDAYDKIIGKNLPLKFSRGNLGRIEESKCVLESRGLFDDDSQSSLL